MGPAQMAERAVFAAVDDWTFDSEPRDVAVVGDANGSTTVEVASSRGRWTVTVEVGRAMPTISCGAPGGLPAKPGTEWIVTSVRAH